MTADSHKQRTARAWSVALFALLAIGIVVSVFLLFRPGPRLPEVRETIARAIDRLPEQIEVNLPPAEGRYPGALLFRATRDAPALLVRGAIRPVEEPASTGRIELSRVEGAGAWLGGGFDPFSGRTQSAGHLEVTVSLRDFRIFEPGLSRIRQALLEDPDLRRLRMQGREAEVIVRAFEARPVLSIRRGALLAGEAWTSQREALLEAGAESTGSDSVGYSFSSPVVIAYETQIASLVADSLSAGQPSRVILRAVELPRFATAGIEPGEGQAERGPRSVGFLVLGTSSYRHPMLGDLPSAHANIELVRSTLASMGAVDLSPMTTGSEGLNRASFEAHLDNATSEAERLRLQDLIVYYFGHAVVLRGGHLYLPLSTYAGDLAEDIGEETMLGLPRVELESPRSPLTGTNIGDILDVVNAALGEMPQSVDGMIGVSEIHQRLSRSGLRFGFLIDSCAPSNSMSSLAEALRLGDSSSSAAEVYRRALKHFSAAPYLRSSDVIILGSRPGSIATPEPAPFLTPWTSHGVGPLAAQLYRRCTTALIEAESQTWGQLLQSLAVDVGEGEFRSDGSISWSDFESWRQIPLVTPIP